MLKVSTPDETVAPAEIASAPSPIRLDRVTYRYGDRVALDDVSLAVPQGAIFGLLGPNGSGKSTLISLLIGRRTASDGSVMLFGESPRPALRARIGIVFQEPSLDPLMTVRDTMALQARLFDMPSGAAHIETERLLAHVGLLDRASALTSTLSGGMKRRLEIARALLPAPDVILLDEPTLALDPDSKQAVWQYLLEANAAGCTLLLATNDVAEADRYCHTVALLDEGRLIADGAPSDLKRDLRRESVRIEWKAATPPSRQITAWPGVGDVRSAGHATHVTVDDASAFLVRLFESAGSDVAAVHVEESTLEDVYFQIVGRGITSTVDE